MTLEKQIGNLIQCIIDEHEAVNENWFSIVEVGAIKREIKVTVQEVADKIRKDSKDMLDDLKSEIEYFASSGEFEDKDAWNIGLQAILKNANLYLEQKVLGLLVEPSKEKTK